MSLLKNMVLNLVKSVQTSHFHCTAEPEVVVALGEWLALDPDVNIFFDNSDLTYDEWAERYTLARTEAIKTGKKLVVISTQFHPLYHSSSSMFITATGIKVDDILFGLGAKALQLQFIKYATGVKVTLDPKESMIIRFN